MKKIGVTKTKDLSKDFAKALARLVDYDVLVGIPQEKDSREDGDPIGNAAIGYIQENGAPEKNIPARPFLSEGILQDKSNIEYYFVGAGKATLAGDETVVLKWLNAAGLSAQASVRRKITEGPFIPLADSTLRARARRGRKGAQAELEARSKGEAAGTDLAKPLIDTGQLRNSINYIIRNKKQ